MSRTVLRLECFHDDIAARRRAARSMSVDDRRRLQARYFATDMRVGAYSGTGTWVAEVKGIDRATGRLMRTFVDGLKDYTEANSVGSRGVYKYYVLTSGPLYEIMDRPGYGKPPRRRFCRVVGSKITPIETAEALKCLQ